MSAGPTKQNENTDARADPGGPYESSVLRQGACLEGKSPSPPRLHYTCGSC